VQKSRKKKKATRKAHLNLLEKATAAYYDSLTHDQIKEENRLEAALTSAAVFIDFNSSY
jgi:hypothetical protein